jgi:hypothetical protein
MPDYRNMNMVSAPKSGSTTLTHAEHQHQSRSSGIQEIFDTHTSLLGNINTTLLKQAQHSSRYSFRWAWVWATVGLLFFITATIYTICTGMALNALIPVFCGAAFEIVAGVAFYLSNHSNSTIVDLQGRIEKFQRYMLANDICESLGGEERHKTRSALVREIADIKLHTSEFDRFWSRPPGTLGKEGRRLKEIGILYVKEKQLFM